MKKVDVLSWIFVGFVVLLLLVGRWGPHRIFGDQDIDYLQVRYFLVPIIFVSVLALYGWGQKTFSYNPQHLWIYVPVFLLFGYLLCTTLWAREVELCSEKAVDVLLLGVSLLSIILLQSRCQIQHHVLWFVLAAACLTLALMAFLRPMEEGRIAVLGGGPNVYGRNMAVGAIIFTYYFLTLKQKIFFIPLLAGIALFVFLLISSGSRGAMVAFLGGEVVLFFALWIQKKLPWWRLIVLAGAGALAIPITQMIAPDFYRIVLQAFEVRVVELTYYKGYVASRDVLFEEAMSYWKVHPVWGGGLNNFVSHSSLENYPHNLILELLTDGGLVVLGLFFLAFGNTVKALFVNRQSLNPCALGVLGLLFFAAQFSGNFYDSRGIFLLLPFCLTPDPETKQD